MRSDMADLSQTGDIDPAIASIPGFMLPPSVYMSEQARLAFRERVNRLPVLPADATITRYRAAMDEHFYRPRLKRALEAFPVEITEERIAGVRVDRIRPSGGLSEKQRGRMLINLHGGGFRVGAGAGGLLESVPICAASGMEVVSIDYRQGPEHAFPAASEDVAAVYHTLLEDYEPGAVGIFGVSAGGVLAAMSIAWFDEHNIPIPAAIALISAPADDIWGGDSRYWVPPMFGMASPPPDPNPPPTGMPYVDERDLNNPLVSPAVSPDLLARFPPTLIITGTRAGEMSAAVHSHAQLIKAGSHAELHVWEGMWHGFTEDFELPEAADARDVIVKFLERHVQAPARFAVS
jgi:acetyl esterase/lipase